MNERITEFESVLKEEDILLNRMVKKQSLMQQAVREKDWENLTNLINEMNEITEKFVQIDTKREGLQDSMAIEELKPYFETISSLRSKLFKCKVENQVLSKYVNITREFIQNIVDNALPQSGSKVYSNTGKIIQTQPTSVVVNLDF